MMDIREIQERIKIAMYENLFLMISQSDRREITAREIDERHEEKLLQLGPVLERLNDEVLDNLIDRTFSIMVRRSKPYWEGRVMGSPWLIRLRFCPTRFTSKSKYLRSRPELKLHWFQVVSSQRMSLSSWFQVAPVLPDRMGRMERLSAVP